MSLPTEWVEKIFHKLTLAYGQDFLNRWKGIPIADVKTDWAHCLAGFAEHPEAIGFALLNLPDSRPPTAQDFRAICRQAPRDESLALNAPKAPADVVDKEIAKIVANAMKPPVDERGQVDHKRWAKQLRDRHQRGEVLSLVQIKSYQTALDMAAA